MIVFATLAVPFVEVFRAEWFRLSLANRYFGRQRHTRRPRPPFELETFFQRRVRPAQAAEQENVKVFKISNANSQIKHIFRPTNRQTAAKRFFSSRLSRHDENNCRVVASNLDLWSRINIFILLRYLGSNILIKLICDPLSKGSKRHSIESNLTDKSFKS